MLSSLRTSYAAASCFLDTVLLSTTTSSYTALTTISAPAKVSGDGNAQVWTGTPADDSTHQYIQFYIKAESLGDSLAYSALQVLVIGCPQDAILSTETQSTFTLDILEVATSTHIFTFSDPTSTNANCHVASNAIVDEI